MPTAQLPLLTRQRILALATEATAGTVQSLSATNAATRVFDRKLSIVRDTIAREAQGTFGSDANVAGAAHTELTFKTHLHGGGSASGATPVPLWAPVLLTACGMAQATDVFSTSMVTSGWKTITAGHYQAGRLKRGRGMMGTFKLSGEVGKPGVLDWSFVGGYVSDPTAVAVLTGMTYEIVSPPILANASALTLNGATVFKFSKFELDLGNKVSPREDATQAGGYWGGWIGARDPKLTIDPETLDVSNFDWQAFQSGNTTCGATFVFNGGTNNTITIAAPVMSLSKAPGDDDRNGMMVEGLEFMIDQDNLSVTFA